MPNVVTKQSLDVVHLNERRSAGTLTAWGLGNGSVAIITDRHGKEDPLVLSSTEALRLAFDLIDWAHPSRQWLIAAGKSLLEEGIEKGT